MDKYRIEQDGDKITVWDDGAGVGLRFTQGATLQRYTSELMIKEGGKVATSGLDVDALSVLSNALTGYAAERFPMEFAPIKQ